MRLSRYTGCLSRQWPEGPQNLQQTCLRCLERMSTRQNSSLITSMTEKGPRSTIIGPMSAVASLRSISSRGTSIAKTANSGTLRPYSIGLSPTRRVTSLLMARSCTLTELGKCCLSKKLSENCRPRTQARSSRMPSLGTRGRSYSPSTSWPEGKSTCATLTTAQDLPTLSRSSPKISKRPGKLI